MTSKDWRIIEEFIANSNRLYEIFYDLPSKSNLSIAEILDLAEKDELFSFVLHLLLEETKCRSSNVILPELAPSNFCSIDSWLKQYLAGLICDPFPTVEYLLKKQGLPSVFSEFDEIFAATKLLNSLTSIYNPNLERIDASNLLNIGQYEIYLNLPPKLKAEIDSIFVINVPNNSEAPFAKGPSFRIELCHYINFDSRTDFKIIPTQLLEIDEGIDIGSSFGKRWSRRLVAKSSAYDKINFNLLKIGTFPLPVPKSLESSNMIFQVQLPESVGIELLHQNSFDNSALSSEFLDYSAFSVHFAKFLEEVPAILTKKLKNTDIFAHAPLLNPSKSGSKASLASFRALLLVLGIRGHLNFDTLPPVDIHEILNFDSEGTSACLLLSLALSSLKNHDQLNDQSKFLTKLFTMHLSSFQTSLGLEIPPILQLSATLSIGIFKFRSFDRGTTQILLKEIFRPLPLNVNTKPLEDTPLFSLVPAITLGLCLMGSSSSQLKDENNYKFAEDIQTQLQSNLLLFGNKTQHLISVLIASSFINIGNSQFNPQKLPWSRSLPDLLDKPEGIVFWCHLTWRLCRWNEIISNLDDQGHDKIKLKFIEIFDSVCNPADDSIWTDSSELGIFIYACQVLMANSVYLSLKLAGTRKSHESLNFWINKLFSFKILLNTDSDFFLTRIQSYLLTTLQYLLLCKCLIYVGSGDSYCWKLLRNLMSHPLLFKYGNGKLFYSSIGFLFAGKGRLTIKSENEQGEINYLVVASLLCSMTPIIPTSPVDAEFTFTTLLNSLWPLAMTSQ